MVSTLKASSPAPKITPAILRGVVLTVPAKSAELLAPRLQSALEHYGIREALEVAHFLAQIGHESGFEPKAENLTYTAARILKVFPTRVKDLADARTLEFNPVALGNRVYSNRLGNGPGEGYLYRGRGFTQITGKYNYGLYGRSTGFDIVKNPELALQYGVGSLIAASYWAYNGCGRLARADNLPGVTRSINGGLTGLEGRTILLARAKKALGL